MPKIKNWIVSKFRKKPKGGFNNKGLHRPKLFLALYKQGEIDYWVEQRAEDVYGDGYYPPPEMAGDYNPNEIIKLPVYKPPVEVTALEYRRQPIAFDMNENGLYNNAHIKFPPLKSSWGKIIAGKVFTHDDKEIMSFDVPPSDNITAGSVYAFLKGSICMNITQV